MNTFCEKGCPWTKAIGFYTDRHVNEVKLSFVLVHLCILVWIAGIYVWIEKFKNCFTNPQPWLLLSYYIFYPSDSKNLSLVLLGNRKQWSINVYALIGGSIPRYELLAPGFSFLIWFSIYTISFSKLWVWTLNAILPVLKCGLQLQTHILSYSRHKFEGYVFIFFNPGSICQATMDLITVSRRNEPLLHQPASTRRWNA